MQTLSGPNLIRVNEILSKNLNGKGIARWNNPRGGYFISLNVLNGCAKEQLPLQKKPGLL